MRTEISEFHGSLQPEEFLDWLATVEEILEFKGVAENKRVPLLATRLRGRAIAWWQQLKLTHTRLGKAKIATWEKMKKHMRGAFLPYNYQRLMYQRLQNLKQGLRSVDEYTTEFYQLIARNEIQETEDQLVSRYIGGLKFQIQDVVNMFDPVSIFAAHQRALVVEKQTKRSSNATTNVSAGGSGSGVNKAVGSGVNKAVSSSSGGQFNRTGGLKCFGCGEVGHRKSECRKTAGKSALFLDPDDYVEDEYFLIRVSDVSDFSSVSRN